MLPMQLLRVRTKKGDIIPSFCTSQEDLQLAREIIREFKESAAKKEQKKHLYQRIEAIESRHDDYKLVRGFAVLLERRCQFTSQIAQDIAQMGDAAISAHRSPTIDPIDPIAIRKAIFEESAKSGFALTDFEREKIITAVASIMNLSTSYVKQAMWGDLEDNMVFQRLDPIDDTELVGWYNLSLIQTLLFNCTRLEFTVHGGLNWKSVLRNVRHLGLMYTLQHRSVANQDKVGPNVEYGDEGSTTHIKEDDRPGSKSSEDTTELVCSIDGPLSIFKLSERYGTSIAKLVPAIVSAEKWSLNASTIRKTMSGKKIYQFKISSSVVPALLGHQYGRSSDVKSSSYSNYDSSVEERFASRFEQSANGWKLVREPDPLIVSEGRAFIPDFMFEKYGKKVYLEIVGFWTKEYLERKMHKIRDVYAEGIVDLFVAVDQDLVCSKITPLQTSSLPRDRIIFFKNGSVPVKMIIDYLKQIDKEVINRQVSDSNLQIRFDDKQDIISACEVASEYNIAVDSAITIAARDNSDRFLNVGDFFISRSKANALSELLKEAVRLPDAAKILSENSIPEQCHTNLISVLGYQIIWKNMDASSAVISRVQE